MMRVAARLCALVLVTTPLWADVVHLDNGDRLSGQVKRLDAGKLTLDTAYAGEVQIAWGQVVQLTTVDPLSVEFMSGRSEVGRISSPESGTFQVETSSGPTRANRTEIVALRRPAVAATREPGILGNWHGNADLGYTLTRGNNEIDNLTIQFSPERKTPKDRISARFKSLHNVQQGLQASSVYRTSVRYDRFLSPRTFAFGIGSFEKDELAKLDYRISEGGGFGVRFQFGPATQMSMFGGVTFVQENFADVESTLGAEGVAGFELETAFAPLVLTTSAALFPLLTDGRYRLEWDGGLRLPLFGGFTMGLQLFDRFDSDPPQVGVKRNDVGLVSTLGYAF